MGPRSDSSPGRTVSYARRSPDDWRWLVVEDAQDISTDRRRPAVRTLRQPVEPARIQAMLGERLVLEQADVVELTDRSVLLEVRDSTLALALSNVLEVVVYLDLGGATTTLVTEPGRRSSDNPTSRRVELILRARR